MVRRALPLSVAVALLALTLVAGVLVGSADAVRRPEWGHTQARDRVLKHGCHDYTYRYDLSPPPGDWGLETFLIDPRGVSLGSGVALGSDEPGQDGNDPEKGRLQFRICKPNTRTGKFKIKAFLSIQNGSGPDSYTSGWLKPTKFKLHRKRH